MENPFDLDGGVLLVSCRLPLFSCFVGSIHAIIILGSYGIFLVTFFSQKTIGKACFFHLFWIFSRLFFLFIKSSLCNLRRKLMHFSNTKCLFSGLFFPALFCELLLGNWDCGVVLRLLFLSIRLRQGRIN